MRKQRPSNFPFANTLGLGVGGSDAESPDIVEQEPGNVDPYRISPVHILKQRNEVASKCEVACGSASREEDHWGFLAVCKALGDVNGRTEVRL